VLHLIARVCVPLVPIAMPPRLSDADRHRIVYFFKDLHLSTTLIAKRVSCTHSAVVKTLARYRATGDVADRSRSGRPPVMNDASLRRLDRIITRQPTSTSQHLAAQMQQQTGQRVSARTIRRARTQALGRHPVRETITRSLTPAHIAARLAFAILHLISNWHHVLFSDEKDFVLQKTGRVAWIKSGESRPHRDVENQKARVKVWGCVWYGGRSTLHTTSKTVTAQRYTQCLATHLLPSMPTGVRFQLQHDNARPHTAPHTVTWCANFGVNVLPNWPAYSPELNAIEHVWSWMSGFVNNQAPTNRNQLKRAVRLAWQQIPQSTIQGYIDHLPSVCRQIIAAGGDHI
jgi:transposase